MARPQHPLPAWKRGLDVACLAVTAPLTLPLMLLIALLIRIVSPGPALFRQERMGLHGRRFTCFKFRTMHVAAATQLHEAHLAQLFDSAGPMIKLDAVDSRIIPLVGPLLRASGLDELPQLFNVLRSEMSIVGPRPCVPYEFERFGAEDRARFNAVPGLTGLWQVSGKNSTTFRQMIAYDIEYATRLSLGRDLAIICRTPAVILRQVSHLLRQKLARAAGPSFRLARRLQTG